MFCIFNLVSRQKLQVKLTILIVRIEKYISILKQKQWTSLEILRISIILEVKFHLNWQLWIKFLGSNWLKKVYFGSKPEKVNTTIVFCIFEWGISYRSIFVIKLTILISCINFLSEAYLSYKAEMNEQRQWILHIWIS